MSEKIPVDSKVKEEINKEGFEDNAAVIIGKKENMAQKLETLEKEGHAENLGTYIRMHKEIAVPAEKVNERMQEFIKTNNMNAGDGFLVRESADFFSLRYVDKENNIARVSINISKVAELRRKGEEGIYDAEFYEPVIDELKKLGFSLDNEQKRRILQASILEYKGKLEQEERERKSSEFDF